MQDNTLIEGSSFNLSCQAARVPAPTVVWIKDSSGQKTNGNVLFFSKISIKDAGKYTCEANNPCGNASGKTTINVKGTMYYIFLYNPVILVNRAATCNKVEERRIFIELYCLSGKNFTFWNTYSNTLVSVCNGMGQIVFVYYDWLHKEYSICFLSKRQNALQRKTSTKSTRESGC